MIKIKILTSSSINLLESDVNNWIFKETTSERQNNTFIKIIDIKYTIDSQDRHSAMIIYEEISIYDIYEMKGAEE